MFLWEIYLHGSKFKGFKRLCRKHLSPKPVAQETDDPILRRPVFPVATDSVLRNPGICVHL